MIWDVKNVVKPKSTATTIQKKVIPHGPGKAYFLVPVHLFIGDVQPDGNSCHMWKVLNMISVHSNASLCSSTTSMPIQNYLFPRCLLCLSRRRTSQPNVVSRSAGSDGSMSASGSAGPGFDPRRGSKFHLKIFNPGARRGGDVHFLIARLYITGLD